MTTLYLENKSELKEKITVALHNFKNFDAIYNGKTVKVTTNERRPVRGCIHYVEPMFTRTRTHKGE